MAINALYQDAPVELLGEERQRRALERLCAKDQLHFRINLDATGTPCGVRLAHVHLAWLLFQEWADTDGITTIEQAWAAELDRALTSHLEWGRDVQAGSLLYQLLISARLHDEPEVKPNRIDTIREIDCTWHQWGHASCRSSRRVVEPRLSVPGAVTPTGSGENRCPHASQRG